MVKLKVHCSAVLENSIIADVLMNPNLSDVDTLLSQISHHHGHLLPQFEYTTYGIFFLPPFFHSFTFFYELAPA